MNCPLTPVQVDRLRLVVSSRLGLRLDDAKLELLAEAVTQRAQALGARDVDEYVERLSGEDREEIRALAPRLTVGETYFFRNTNDLDAFVRAVLPDRLRARSGKRRLRILSAGCSSGEEPYTIAMLVHQVPELASWKVTIRGVDVNRAALARAMAGRYGAWSLRQTPSAMRERFFRAEGAEHRVNDEVRALVSFEERNLAEDDPDLWAPDAFDVVFCRNVVMYLEPEAARRLVARITRSLSQGGFLFLGHAETLRGVSTDFRLCHTHETFYYQLRSGGVAAAPEPGDAPSREETPLTAPDGEWVATIRRASERIEELVGARQDGDAAGSSLAPARAARAPAGGGPGPGPFARAIELLRQERFSDALAALGSFGGDREVDRDALLLRAVLLASSGDPEGAELACARILELDELNAEAHYVKALCREHARDADGAANHDLYALYLDPTFAMPRLHLAIMAKKAGDLDVARRELSRALLSLAVEDASRILLLGGGFSRDALVEMCRSELRACGGLA